MGDLGRRVGSLERRAPANRGAEITAIGERLIERFARLAKRVRGTPGRPVDQQSIAEQMVRAALAEADAAPAPESFGARFWASLRGQLRAYADRASAPR